MTFTRNAFEIFLLVSKLALFLILAPSTVHGGSPPKETVDRVFLVRKAPLEQQITGLRILRYRLKIPQAPKANDTSVRLQVQGLFDRPDWNLLHGGEKIPINPNTQQFDTLLRVERSAKQLTLSAIGPRGEVSTETFDLTLPPFETIDKIIGIIPGKRWFVNVGTAASWINYTDSRIDAFDQLAVTVKASFVALVLPPFLDAGVSAYFTALPVMSTRNLNARFLGINARIGYVFPKIREPWRLSLLTGVYYTTMFASSNRFGFSHVAGPQLFPTVRRLFNNGDIGIVYAKLSPVTDGLSVLSLDNREIALGVSWTRSVKKGGPSLSMSFDLAQLLLKFGSVAINSTSYSLGVGLGL